LNAHLEGILEADEYQDKKRELLSEKTGLKQQLTKISRRGHRWLEPLEEWIKEAHQAHFITNKENLQLKAEHIRKIGSNRLLLSGKAAIVCENPWKILAENSPCSDWRDTQVKYPVYMGIIRVFWLFEKGAI